MTTHPDSIKQIDRLVRFWPQANLTDEAVLAYGEAASGKDPRDVRLATDRLIGGKVERNHEYIPPPAQFAFQINRARDERLDEEQRNKPRLAPPAPSTDLTAEQRKALVASMRAAGKIRSPGKETGPTDAEHTAAIKRTIAEAMKLETAELDAMIASLPDRKPATQRSAA